MHFNLCINIDCSSDLPFRVKLPDFKFSFDPFQNSKGLLLIEQSLFISLLRNTATQILTKHHLFHVSAINVTTQCVLTQWCGEREVRSAQTSVTEVETNTDGDQGT